MAYMEYVPIKDLILLINNPRTVTKDQFAKLCQSLKDDPKFLELRPVLINRVNGELNVYAGNQRVRAALKLNLKEIPCIIEDNVDPDLMKERIAKDNLHYGEWDFEELLNGEWDIDILLKSGFTNESLTGDFGIEEDKPKKSKSCTRLCPEESFSQKFDSMLKSRKLWNDIILPQI